LSEDQEENSEFEIKQDERQINEPKQLEKVSAGGSGEKHHSLASLAKINDAGSRASREDRSDASNQLIIVENKLSGNKTNFSKKAPNNQSFMNRESEPEIIDDAHIMGGIIEPLEIEQSHVVDIVSELSHQEQAFSNAELKGTLQKGRG